MSGLYEFIKDQYATLPLAITPQEAKGKTYVVTGANTGLGFECAKHLVRLGSTKVIIAVRSSKKGDEAKAKIEVETGNKGIAEVWHLDLSSYESVKKFAKKLQALDRVDAVIENASVAMSTRTEAEGLETTLTVNIISTFLLALLVLPKLEETAKKFGGLPHLVIVGSGAGFSAKGSFEQIQGDIIDGLDKAPLEGTKR
jgi:NAD(P)-dependent dehydrogenase (short-subunit alcohol dehydrogenase family)